MGDSDLAGPSQQSSVQQRKGVGDGDSGATLTLNFYKLINFGLKQAIAAKLDQIICVGKIRFDHLDYQAIDELMCFESGAALEVLDQFAASNLKYVWNKSDFLRALLKAYCVKLQLYKQGCDIESLAVSSIEEINVNRPADCNGYEIEVDHEQRMYYLSFIEHSMAASFEIFCGKIPKTVFEDELVVLFKTCGLMLSLRLIMKPTDEENRGFAFVRFSTREAAKIAIECFNNYEIRPRKRLRVTMSDSRDRLFVKNIPEQRTKEEIFKTFNSIVEGLKDVIIYNDAELGWNNRGFCFLEFHSRTFAFAAKSYLNCHNFVVWNREISVDWADPINEPDEMIMNETKVLFVRNILDSVPEDFLVEKFAEFGRVERIVLKRDFAFVQFDCRRNAERALTAMNGTQICARTIEVKWARPPIDRQKRTDMMRDRHIRMRLNEMRRQEFLQRLVVDYLIATQTFANFEFHH